MSVYKNKNDYRRKQSLSKLTGSGPNQISARIRPDPVPSKKWPVPALGSSRSLVLTSPIKH